jgi:alginate O-acetyltransferase complex protein AlgI
VLFNSLQFVIFFIAVVLTYYALPIRGPSRNILLLAASFVFYAVAQPFYLLVLIAIIAIDYFAGQWIEQAAPRNKRLWLGLSLLANLSILFTFKYFNFANSIASDITGFSAARLDWMLPIGISFHTFQAMSYTIEVYRGRVKAERNLLNYALYVMFFPQLVAGPIERPYNLLPQFRTDHPFDPRQATLGLRLMLWGYCKKILIADRLALLVDAGYRDPLAFAGPASWLVLLFFSFQIYCDFSGYTDIARGAARILGFDLMLNFNKPYLARSIQDFWRRWHISLSTWFRDYVYIPLGGSHQHKLRNIFIVFLLSGLWHGAGYTFLLWGLCHCLLYLIDGILINAIRPAVTFVGVSLAWVFFRAPNLDTAISVLAAVFSPFRAPIFNDDVWIGLSLIAGLMVVEFASRDTQVEIYVEHFSRPVRWLAYYSLLILLFSLGEFSRKPFIYFQF